METVSETNISCDDHSYFGELEKLRFANRLAQQILIKNSEMMCRPLSDNVDPKMKLNLGDPGPRIKTKYSVADSTRTEEQNETEAELSMNRQNDNWGANEYLKNDKLKFVQDYLCRTDQLINMSDSVKHVARPFHYETVSSLEELFQMPEKERINTKEMTYLSVSNSVDDKSSNDSSILSEEKNAPVPLKNNFVMSSARREVSVSNHPGNSIANINTELCTHRPNTDVHQIPVFSSDVSDTPCVNNNIAVSPSTDAKTSTKTTPVMHKQPQQLDFETVADADRVLMENYTVKRDGAFKIDEFSLNKRTGKGITFTAAVEPKDELKNSSVIRTREKQLQRTSFKSNAEEQCINTLVLNNTSNEHAACDEKVYLDQNSEKTWAELKPVKSEKPNKNQLAKGLEHSLVPKLNLSKVNVDDEEIFDNDERMKENSTTELRDVSSTNNCQSDFNEKLSIGNENHAALSKKNSLPKVKLPGDVLRSNKNSNVLRPSSASKFNRPSKSASPPRKWEKSSIAWSSYGKEQLRTWSSIQIRPKKSSLEKQNSGLNRVLVRPTQDLSTTIENYWSCLPEEVVIYIFGFLSLPDLLKVGSVCKTFYRIADDFHLWKAVKVVDVTVNDDWFSAMGKRNPQSLSLLRCNGSSVTNVGLRTFFKNCKTSLTDLHVEKCSGTQLTGDSILLHASCHCRRLKQINVAWSKTTDNGIIAISLALPKLQILNLNGNSGVGEEAFEILTQKHGKHLESLEMSGCFSVSSDVLSSLVMLTTSLHTLNIGLCSKITSECIIMMCSHLKSLKHLDLRGVKSVTNQCLHAIATHCEKLQTLIVSNCPSISDVGVAEIAAYRNLLTHLDISGCSSVTDQGVTSFLMVANAIEYFDLSGTGATHISVDFIVHNNHSTLKTLKLSFCHNITLKCLLDLLKVSVNLKSLHLYGCKRIKLSQLMKVNKGVVIEK